MILSAMNNTNIVAMMLASKTPIYLVIAFHKDIFLESSCSHMELYPFFGMK
jgi:hypothetical protein